MIYHAKIDITQRDAAGQPEAFIAHISRHPNPYTPSQVEEYRLDGIMVHGIEDSITVTANDRRGTEDEVDAVRRAYRLLPVNIREGWALDEEH